MIRDPIREGLVPFTTLEAAAAGAHAIVREYPRHAEAARAVAEEYFDSKRILTRLLAKLRM